MTVNLGPHSLGRRTESTILWAGNATIIKQAFGITLLQEAKALNPNILTVCRPIWKLRSDSGQGAAGEVLDLYRQWGFYPDVTELWNESDEVGQNLNNGLERRLALHEEAVPILHAAGLKVAGFSHSVGQPQALDVEFLAAHNWANADYLALHEYWFDSLPFDSWTALRYRRIKEWARDQLPPILITECGRHYAGEQDWGWRKCDLSAYAYATELLAYAAALAQDNISGCVFTVPDGENPLWDTFDTEPIAGDLAAANIPLNNPAKESPMSLQTDAHRLIDEWTSQISGPGFNPDTELGKLWASDVQHFGVPIAPELQRRLGDRYIICRYCTDAILIAWQDDQDPPHWHAKAAHTVAELSDPDFFA